MNHVRPKMNRHTDTHKVRNELELYLRKKGITCPIHIEFKDSHHAKRIYILLVAETESGYLLGRDHFYDQKIKDPQKAVQKTVKTVADELLQEIATGRCVDEYMQDQLVVFQALAEGRSVIESGVEGGPSMHTRTAWWMVEELLGVEFDEHGGCEGAAFVVGKGYRSKSVLQRQAQEADLARELEKLEV